jgi:cytochrome P450
MKLPDGPKTPLLVQQIQWTFRPLELLHACTRGYGDTFKLLSKKHAPVVFLSHPQAIKEIFTADPALFDTGRKNKLLQPIFGDYSLLLLDGDSHQRQRRLLMPPFHGDRMRVYGQLVCDLTKKAINQWKVGEPFPVRLPMQEVTLSVILQAVFGLEQGQRFDQLRELLIQALDTISSPITSSLLFFPNLRQDWGNRSPWGRFLRLRHQIDQLLYREIQERRQKMDSSCTDILTLLLLARDENNLPMTDTELRDELITLLFAGHETTASALAWAMYWIHNLPEVRSKLLSELSALSPETDPTAISQLPYLNAVCQETLRLSPIFLTAQDRILKAPLQVMGYKFEPGATLVPCIYLIHQRKDIYSEPRQFRPERFLERKFSPHEYLPFGGGNRGCIGMAFANFQMKLVLATILSHLEMSLVDQRPVRPVRRGATLAPPTDMLMVVTGQYDFPMK